MKYKQFLLVPAFIFALCVFCASCSTQAKSHDFVIGEYRNPAYVYIEDIVGDTRLVFSNDGTCKDIYGDYENSLHWELSKEDTLSISGQSRSITYTSFHVKGNFLLPILGNTFVGDPQKSDMFNGNYEPATQSLAGISYKFKNNGTLLRTNNGESDELLYNKSGNLITTTTKSGAINYMYLDDDGCLYTTFLTASWTSV